MNLEALRRHREERDRFLREHYASPLPDEQRASFTGLDWFPPDPAWVVDAAFEPAAGQVPVPSSAGTERPYDLAGIAGVTIGGTVYRLAVLDDGDGGRFIPFRDGTAGTETYAGGRYVGIEVAPDGSAVIDFNTASNPWCVYDEEFTCPLPPPSNVIAEPIPAGEKVWRAGG